MLPESILSVTESFMKLPAIGRRGGQKLALDILESTPELYKELIDNLNQMKEKVKFCSRCGFFAENDLCNICRNNGRDKYKICLIEKATDVLNMEKSQIYNGQYHVLKHLISPIDNIFADKTTLSDLFDIRIPSLLINETVNIELILFFQSGFASETTASYIKEVIKSKSWQNQISLSRLAEGLPLYYNPDNLDQATMIRALEDRRTLI
jgi:recombination protein RecR